MKRIMSIGFMVSAIWFMFDAEYVAGCLLVLASILVSMEVLMDDILKVVKK